MKLVTTREMQDLEKRADQGGLSFSMMMENAGRATASLARQRSRDPNGTILILVGPGNNGGDGLVAARYLCEWGLPVAVYIWKRSLEHDAPLARVVEKGIATYRASQDPELSQLAKLVGDCDIMLDALLGTGVSGPLRPDLSALLRVVRRVLQARTLTLPQDTMFRPTDSLSLPEAEQPMVIAVDVPTGLVADTGETDPLTPSADATITFAYPKRGHVLFPGAASVGELIVADIGIPDRLAEEIDLELVTSREVASWFPDRPTNANKGTFGKVLTVAGCKQYVGAVRLAAQAAYRGGAGLVTCAVGYSIYPIVAAGLTEPTFVLLPDDMGAIAPQAERIVRERLGEYDALLVGPGLGTEPGTARFLQQLLGITAHARQAPIGFHPSEDKAPSPPDIAMILDADALNLLAPMDSWWRHLPPDTIVTPHPGEMARLMRCSVQDVQADRLSIAQRAANAWGCTVILKGAYSVISSPGEPTTVLPFANAALATAGTGDVLAGLVTSLRAQGLSAHKAAICGAFLHGVAGKVGATRFGRTSLVASDLLTCIPEAYKHVQAP